LLPTGVLPFGAGQRIQPALLHAMDELARLTGGGHKVVPAAGDVGFFIEAEDAAGDGIAVVMVVKEPAVVAGLAQCGLNGFEVHGGMITRRMGSGYAGKLYCNFRIGHHPPRSHSCPILAAVRSRTKLEL